MKLPTHSIRSNLPGTASYRFVDDGAKVEKGDKVVAIECMKQLWDLEAPAAGVVQHRVALGEMVEQDFCVATIESE